MKRRILVFLLLLAVLAFSGCALRTVEEMYALPKRSEQYNKLQTAIDGAMVGLEYSAPISGDHRQTLQTVDLDGDGREEYLVFAKGNSEKPLVLLIFRQEDDGQCNLLERLSFRGSAFEQVEYANMDGAPGQELVLGRQVSDQIMGSVSVYSFQGGAGKLLMSTDYSRFVTGDLNTDGLSDLMVLRPGELTFGVAVLYSFPDGQVERSVEAPMSCRVERISRVDLSRLYGGSPAIYVSSSSNDTVLTDVFALRMDRLVNVAFSGGQGTVVDNVHNYAVYAEDLDGDDVFELPKIVAMKPVSPQWNTKQQFLLRWYAIDLQGNETDKLCTFHNFAGGWYLRLDIRLADYLTMEETGENCTFYMWDESHSKVTSLFTIAVLTGADREHQAIQNNRFVLHRGEDVIYTGRLEPGSAMYGFSEEYLINSFRLIQQDR